MLENKFIIFNIVSCALVYSELKHKLFYIFCDFYSGNCVY